VSRNFFGQALPGGAAAAHPPRSAPLRRRMVVRGPVFGQLKQALGPRHFRLHRLEKVRAEWGVCYDPLHLMTRTGSWPRLASRAMRSSWSIFARERDL